VTCAFTANERHFNSERSIGGRSPLREGLEDVEAAGHQVSVHVGLGRGARLAQGRLPGKGELEGDVKGLRDEPAVLPTT
jgi:hypothetical protein